MKDEKEESHRHDHVLINMHGLPQLATSRLCVGIERLDPTIRTTNKLTKLARPRSRS